MSQETLLASLMYSQFKYHERKEWPLTVAALLEPVAPEDMEIMDVKEAVQELDKYTSEGYKVLKEKYEEKSKCFNNF